MGGGLLTGLDFFVRGVLSLPDLVGIVAGDVACFHCVFVGLLAGLLAGSLAWFS